MVLDSNILIYAANEGTASYEMFVCKKGNAVASVTRVEVYGFSGLKVSEKIALDVIFAFLDEHPLDDQVIEKSIQIRQKRKMRLADAIIAATALVHKLPLVTRNEEDFLGVEGLAVINPWRL